MTKMKKKNMLMMLITTSVVLLSSCLSTDADDFYNNWYNTANGSTGSSGTVTEASGELSDFEVAIDKTTAEPIEVAKATYPDEADAISTQQFTTTVTIDMANPMEKTENGVTITVADGKHIAADHGKTKGICYVVSGTTTDGSLTISGSADYEVNLNNVNISNSQSTALNLDGKGAAYIVLTGTNKLTDGTEEDHKSALYGKGKMLFSGSGSLEIQGQYNNGIQSKSYVLFEKGINVYVNAANHGIKGSDAIINGGIINVETAGLGAKGINCDVDITINGGRTTVIATGNGEWDDTDLETKAVSCIKCDSVLTINGGEVYVKATGSGGKGLKADWECYINGGKVRAITTGGLYYNNGTTENLNYKGNTDNIDDAYTSSPKGIKIGTKNEHGILNITGGDIMVRTSGTNGEGIESKGTLDITGGSVMVASYDDAINASSDLTISGGTVVAVGTNNDGIDTNGNLYIKGGNIVAYGANGAEAGIDAEESHALYITGGSLFAIGGRIDCKLGSTSQGLVQASGSIAANSTVSIRDVNRTYATFTMPSYSNSGTILITAEGMSNGSSYTLVCGDASASVTATTSLSNSMGGGPGGGGPGGGRW